MAEKKDKFNSSQGDIPAVTAMRLLTPQESERMGPPLPWWKKIPTYMRNSLGLSTGPTGTSSDAPPGSGVGFIYPPYYSIYNLVYGLIPIADLPKYRLLYRNQPDLKAGIDLIVNLATAKGFTIEYGHEDARKLLEDIIDKVDLDIALQVVCRDMLVFGNAMLEIMWEDAEEEESEIELDSELMSFIKDDYIKLERELMGKNTQEIAYVATKQFEPAVNSWRKAIRGKRVYSKKDGKYYCKATRMMRGKSKNIAGVKALDPIYMRVRADPYGNIYGYIQWLQWPPAVIDTDSLIHFRNAPTSEAYQTVYGQSQLLPLIKNTDLLNMFDMDVANWIHNQAVLPLWIKAGADPTKPYSTEQMKQLVSDWASRTSATTVFTKSDVEIEVLKGGGRDLKVDWWQKYLLERRMMALGVPPVFLGQTEGVNKAISEVMLSDFISRIQAVQNHIADLLVNQLFVPLITANFGEETIDEYKEPKMIWKPIVEEDRNERLMRVDRYAVDGIISVNEARQVAGWQPFRRPEFEEFDPEYDVPKLLRIPPQLGKFGMPEKPTQPLTTPSGEKPRDEPEGEPGKKNVPKGIKTVQPQPTKTPKEAIKIRALQISNDLFGKELEDIINEVAFELKAGGVLVKDIRTKYREKGRKAISKWLIDAKIEGKEKLESKYLRDFMRIIDEKIDGYNG